MKNTLKNKGKSLKLTTLGFTLIELLAVIVILAIIALIATPIVLNIINDAKESTVLRSADFYLEGVELAIAQSTTKGINIVNGIYPIMQDGNVCIGELSSNECIGKILKIEVDGEKPTSGSIELENGNIKDIELILSNKEVTKNSKGQLVLGESKEESICTLINDAEPSGISAGDKYQCKVKNNMESGFENGYYFYVLSTEEDGTTNLIMDRNMYYDENNDIGVVATETNRGLVAWYANEENHGYGPVTALTYLHDATKDWDNIPNMIINYEDENIYYDTQEKGTTGYGNIVTTNNTTIITSKNGEETGKIENLKARMPRYDEVHGIGKCLTDIENGNQYGSCPLWLVNYLNNSTHVTGELLENISGILGYWIFSSNANVSSAAWYVNYNGYLIANYVPRNDGRGVRPVINVNLE